MNTDFTRLNNKGAVRQSKKSFVAIFESAFYILLVKQGI